MSLLATEVPYALFFDSFGKPLSGGYVYYGLENQNPETAPIQVFWDAAGTQPVAQPVRTLNGFPMRSGAIGTVYCATAYSITVRDQAGALIRSSPSSQSFSLATFVTNFAASLLSSAGATLVSFLQAGAGAIVETIQAVLRRKVDAENYGAVGDGATDCYAAIMAALAAYPNGQINLGDGVFVVSQVIDKPVGASIRGKGRGVTRLKMANAANAPAVVRTAGFASLTGTTSTGGEFNSEIRDLTIDGNKANNTAGLGAQLYGKYFRTENVAFENCFGVGLYTEYGGADNFSTTAGTLEASIINVFVQQCGGSGAVFMGPHDMTLKHFTSFSNGGWGFEGYTSIHATDVNTYLNTLGGYTIQNKTVGSITYSGSIYGTAVVGSTATGVGAYLKSGGNTLSASLFGGPTALQIDANNNIIQGQVANSTAFGVLLNGASAQAVMDLTMFNNTGVIFGVSTASLKSQVRAFMGDALGTLNNGTLPGSWDINGYIGFNGALHQLYGNTSVSGGRLCLPNTNFVPQTTQGLFYDTSPPATGAFNKGDRVWNNAPTVGQPKSWVCTVAGTPGTWVSEGNL